MSLLPSNPPTESPRASGASSQKGAPIAPMGVPAALGWTFVVTFLFLALFGVATSVRESSKSDLVSGFSCQVVAYSLGLFLILRVYAPERSIRDFLALRSTAWTLYPLAIFLGILITIPADALYEVICARYPASDADVMGKLFHEASIPRRILMGFVLAGAGPVLEEMFFRGALFRPLKRSVSPLFAAILIGLLFAVIHLEWQSFAPIFILGTCLGLLRIWSGSLHVSMLLHASFNGVALANLIRESAGAVPLKLSNGVIVAAGVASLLLMILAHWLSSKSPACERAREADA